MGSACQGGGPDGVGAGSSFEGVLEPASKENYGRSVDGCAALQGQEVEAQGGQRKEGGEIFCQDSASGPEQTCGAGSVQSAHSNWSGICGGSCPQGDPGEGGTKASGSDPEEIAYQRSKFAGWAKTVQKNRKKYQQISTSERVRQLFLSGAIKRTALEEFGMDGSSSCADFFPENNFKLAS
eukprot:421803-Karenia_brevis.AAC.1